MSTKFKLSREAKEDLIAIAQYGDKHFGRIQSDEYCCKLQQRFELITQQPLLYPQVNHITQGYRRSVCGVHSIYYRLEDGVVYIVRVLNKQNPQMV